MEYQHFLEIRDELKKILGRKSTGKGKSGSKRGAKIPELVLAVLKNELERLGSLQGRYQCRLCLPDRAYLFALVHYTDRRREGILSRLPLHQLHEAANASHQTMVIRLVTHAVRVLAILLTA